MKKIGILITLSFVLGSFVLVFQNCSRSRLSDSDVDIKASEIVNPMAEFEMIDNQDVIYLNNIEDTMSRSISGDDFCFGLNIPGFDKQTGELIWSFTVKTPTYTTASGANASDIWGGHRVYRDKNGIYDCFSSDSGTVEYSLVSAGINAASFKIFENLDGSPYPFYLGDSANVFMLQMPYFSLSNSCTKCVSKFISFRKVEDAKSSGFISFGSGFGKDTKNLFSNGSKYGGVNVASFEMVKDKLNQACSIYGRDKNNVYYLHGAFSAKKIDLKTKEVYLPFNCREMYHFSTNNPPLLFNKHKSSMAQSDLYVRDNSAIIFMSWVYRGIQIKLSGVDIASFEPISTEYYSENNAGSVLNLGHLFAVDKNKVFFNAIGYEGSDPQSLRVCKRPVFYKPNQYSFGTILGRDNKFCYIKITENHPGEGISAKHVADACPTSASFDDVCP
jgi:hypothetical protein